MDIMLQRILELIGTKHGSAQELISALKLSRNAVTDWKSGKLKSYSRYAPQIADYYGVSLDWLSGLTDDRTGIKKEAPSEDEAENSKIIKLREKLSAMSEEELDKLMAMMDLMGF